MVYRAKTRPIEWVFGLPGTAHPLVDSGSRPDRFPFQQRKIGAVSDINIQRTNERTNEDTMFICSVYHLIARAI